MIHGRLPAASLRTMCAGGFQAVHFGHLHIHQHDIVASGVPALAALPGRWRRHRRGSPGARAYEGQLLVDGVVFGQQDAQGDALAQVGVEQRRERPCLLQDGTAVLLDQDIGQHVVQLRWFDRFAQDGCKARPARLHLGFSHRSQQNQGQLLLAGQLLNFLRQRQAVHVGHRQVDQGQVEVFAAPDALERGGTRSGADRLHLPVLKLFFKEQAVGGVVVYHQHAPSMARPRPVPP
jgi:hypothetical protein